MQRTDTIAAFRAALDGERATGRAVGLVPTLGALHDGHRSLIARAAGDCDAVAVTVFVNPLQFDSASDLSAYSAYPADLEADAALAALAGATVLFAPTVAEMGTDAMVTRVNVAGFAEELEGVARPGHFDGVATIVTKLFAVAGPCRAYFGEKDHQQLQVVRRLVADLCLPVEVVACPTVRAPDGLALSSRNVRLGVAERAAAPVLFRALQAAAAQASAGERRAGVLERIVAELVEAEPLATLDYAAAVEEPGGWRLHVAARIGTTRLIDNLAVELPK